MDTAPTIGSFLRAIFANWFTGMSGPISVPLSVAAYFVPNSVAQVLLALTALVCAIFTAYWVWQTERKKTVELQIEIQRLNKPAITEDLYEGYEMNYRTGPVNKRTKVSIPRGGRSLLVEPFGAGSIKVALAAPSDLVADTWLEAEESPDLPVEYRRIHVGDPIDERKWFFSSAIHRIDIVGDETITDVKVRVV